MRVRTDNVRIVGVLACLLAGCTGPGPTVPSLNVTASSAEVTVTATQPDTASQDTTLDVVITGSNFDPGSDAQWAIAGVPSAKVHTNSTRFMSGKRLIANITIAADAQTGLYDVIVTTSTGKKGIGTELFAIQLKLTPLPAGPSLDFVFADQASDNVRSDGRGNYRDGLCGVTARLNLDDGILNPSARPISGSQRRQCGSTAPRFVTLEFDDPVDGVTSEYPVTGQSHYLSVDKIGTVTAEAGAVERKAQLNGTCNRLVFNPDEFPGTSRLLVTRTSASTWSVSAPAGAVAWCVGRNKAYRMPLAVTVTQLP